METNCGERKESARLAVMGGCCRLGGGPRWVAKSSCRPQESTWAQRGLVVVVHDCRKNHSGSSKSKKPMSAVELCTKVTESNVKFATYPLIGYIVVKIKHVRVFHLFFFCLYSPVSWLVSNFVILMDILGIKQNHGLTLAKEYIP